MQKTLAAMAAAAMLAAVPVAHALNAGDLAFTSFNADEDGWSLVTFVDIAAGTTVYFSDNEWNGSAFNTGEGAFTWNTGAGIIAAGTVVRFTAVDQSTRGVSIGSFSAVGDTGMNATAETLYAFLGTGNQQPTTFLAGLSTQGNDSELTPAGLAAGSSAVVLTASTDYAAYNGPRNGQTASNFKALVNDASNWTIIVGGDQAGMVPDTTAFTITPVPEPGTWAMLMAGLGAVGFVARRRAR